MSASLRALLAGIVDYAGLFPPAKLPLEQAIRNYARYRTEPESWMLGRFICPAARLAELAPLDRELFQSGPPFVFAALARGGANIADFLDGLRADLEAIDAFRVRHGERVVVDVLEVRLPADVLQDASRRRGLFNSANDLLRRSSAPLTVYHEAGFGPGWRDSLGELLRSLEGGFKLRCGGLEAAAFPTTEQVASALTACLSAGRPFKATAGLHHPHRRFDPQLETHMHGFLNVFGAGVLASALGLTEEQVRPILEDEDSGQFRFTETAFCWRERTISVEAIVRARRARVVSFGSCSFDEPRDDLRALGLL